jgi:hypothetical protein
MKKILDFIIIFLLVFLIINLFKDDVKKDTTIQSIVIKSIENNYTIPASVKLEVQNNSDKELKINTCTNLQINFMGNDIKTPENFCNDLIIKS